jgi:hypothetical protein
MSTLGKLLAGLGVLVLLGPLGTGIVVFVMAPHYPAAFPAGLLKSLVQGSVLYGPAGVLLVGAGMMLVRRAFARGETVRRAPPPVQFQLALQFKGRTLADYDAMIFLAQQLGTLLGASATVAGHDMGEGEGDKHIFIHTSRPQATFERCKPLLASVRALDGLTAAYRAIDGADYEVLWPRTFAGRFAVA